MQNKTSIKYNAGSTAQWIAIAIIVASVLISGAILYTKSDKSDNGSDTTKKEETKTETNGSVDISKVKTQGTAFLGEDNAPVVVATWVDYKCSFCKKFEEDAVAGIIKDYVNSGKVKILFKNYQFLSPDSQTAGLASRAVWELTPDKFYTWHNAMFGKQASGWGTRAEILALTASLGIDSNKVDQLMTSKATEYQKFIDDEKAEGTSFGIRGTPGTVIGQQMISGAQPYSVFKTAIENLLSK